MRPLTGPEKSNAVLQIDLNLEALYKDALLATPQLTKILASHGVSGLKFWGWIETKNGNFSGYSNSLDDAINKAVESANEAVETVESKRRAAAKLLAEADEMEAAANATTNKE